MRIQQTDRILKESRYARNSHETHSHEHGSNVVSRAWRAMTALPSKLFRRGHE